eukprot:m.652031 g.652031  ORF g.652031 m.652031 type:complete len:50 (+) comp22687_c0_seq2:2266-2415(+)
MSKILGFILKCNMSVPHSTHCDLHEAFAWLGRPYGLPKECDVSRAKPCT